MSFWHGPITFSTLFNFLVQQGILGSFYAFPAPVMGSTSPLKNTGFFSGKCYLETQIWVLGVFIVPGMLMLLGPRGDKAKKKIHIYIYQLILMSASHCNTAVLITAFSLSIFVTFSFIIEKLGSHYPRYIYSFAES